MGCKEIEAKKLSENVFDLIGSQWMLITAAKENGEFNTMTASWGGMGVMWGKDVVWCVVRPIRYTYEFIEEAGIFTISFFSDEYKKALNILGTKSGREGDKIAESGLTPQNIEGLDGKAITFTEAKITMTCRKLYYQDIDPKNFIDETLDKNYPNKDYHRMYIGEIVKCAVKE